MARKSPAELTDAELRDWVEPSAFSVIAEDIRAWLPARGVAAFAGAWGMLNGFALFIVVENNLRSWYVPIAAVAVATLAAAVVEWLRGRAEGEARRRPTLARALSFLVLLIVFELFLYAFSYLATDVSWPAIARDIFGAGSARGTLNLVAFLLLWLLIAARLGSALAHAVERMPRLKSAEELTATIGDVPVAPYEALHRRIVTRQSLLIGIGAGLKAGLVTIPLMVLVYAVLVRLGWATAGWIGGEGWRLPAGENWLTLLFALLLIGMVHEMVMERRWSAALFVLAYFGVHIFRWYAQDSAGTLAGLAAQLWRTVRLAFDIGALWLAPAIVLGALAPFLRRPSQYSWLWGPLALATAAGAAALVLIRQEPFFLAILVLMLGVLALLRWRAATIDQYWPLFGASAAAITVMATTLLLNVTPLAVYRNLDAVMIPPALGSTETAYIEARMERIEASTCPAERIAAYEEALRWIDTFTQPPGYAIPDRNAMRRFVEERRNLERAVFDGATTSGCPPGTIGAEARPLSRAAVFSLSTLAALGFWLTLGLLAAWRTHRDG